MNFFFVITNILTLIKTNQQMILEIHVRFFSKGWGIQESLDGGDLVFTIH